MNRFLSGLSIFSDEAAKSFVCVAALGEPEGDFAGLGVATNPESDIAWPLGRAKSTTKADFSALKGMIKKMGSAGTNDAITAEREQITVLVERILQTTKTSFLNTKAESVVSREWKNIHLTATHEIHEQVVWLGNDGGRVIIWFAGGWRIKTPGTHQELSETHHDPEGYSPGSHRGSPASIGGSSGDEAPDIESSHTNLETSDIVADATEGSQAKGNGMTTRRSSPSTVLEDSVKSCTWIRTQPDGTRYLLGLSPPCEMSSEDVDTCLRHNDAHKRISGEFDNLATLLNRTRDADARGESASSLEVLLAESINQVLLTTMAAFMDVQGSALNLSDTKTCDNSTDTHEISTYVVKAEVGSQNLECWLEFTTPTTQDFTLNEAPPSSRQSSQSGVTRTTFNSCPSATKTVTNVLSQGDPTTSPGSVSLSA